VLLLRPYLDIITGSPLRRDTLATLVVGGEAGGVLYCPLGFRVEIILGSRRIVAVMR